MKAFKYLLLMYAVSAFMVFNKINEASDMVIDEEFHIPQGQLYCNRDFTKWHSKITTPPGIYMWSFVFLTPLKICNGYGLRLTNYIAGMINLVLFYIWFYTNNRKKQMEHKRILTTLNLAIFPPLWFFTNLYYTDVVSIMFIMLMFLFNKLDHHMTAANFGLLAVTVRQTNIIWIVMLMGEYLVKHIYHACVKSYRTKYEIDELDIRELTFGHARNFRLMKNIKFDVWLNFYAYLTMVFVFLIFVFINDGIVLGDKSAHVTVIHIPQIFYFSLFCLFFLWPHFIDRILPFYRLVKKRLALTGIVAVLMAIIIYSNTLVHPYLLADNRHYTFYIWNRFYERYFIFRYAMIPVYMFGLYSIVTKVYEKNNVTFSIFFLPTAFLVLILQKMIEIRYFLVPFILMRIRFYRAPFWALIIEFLLYISINHKTVNIFVEKDIIWPNYDYPQKLIW